MGIKSTLWFTAGVLALTACSGGSDDEASSESQAPPTTSAAQDQRYIGRLMNFEALNLDPQMSDDARTDLIEAGRRWCDTLKSASPDGVDAALSQMYQDQGPKKAAETALVLGTAVQVYCPDVRARLQ